MRTTLDLPEALLHEAMRATHIQTKTKVIIRALEELIRKSKVSNLKDFKGKVDLDLDMDSLRGRGCKS
ncbi:MAG: type II toxin-antitoxin system VapB family antitoxin [Myxococcota bacterium]|nr:type II toxin-antitoxin system VapB family antitoxin [Myxococcota bacterium]